jgi:hypothetical protein
MLTEGDNVIWSDFQNNENQVIHDVKTELMTVEIGSGQYVYQVFWI